MGKLLSLGTKLQYPVVITKLWKEPGDAVKKQETLLQYSYTYKLAVGKEDDEWEEERTNVVDWESPIDGTITSWKLEEGMTINKDMVFLDIEEDCPHSIQFAGLCGMCGRDMTEISWASTSKDTDRAKINMIHDQTFLTVSADKAKNAEEELQRRLLKDRKLTLVVDLDQTVIHACIDPTVGEWQKDPTSPNYDAVKDVRAFQLSDDGRPRGVASGSWYYIKMRPGLTEFLTKIAEMYELHVYTMGTRAYAMNIAKIIDPEKRLFGDRIISRDENGSLTSKNLARLFPVDTRMVVIIDDRADVWPNNKHNLIKVHAYEFFVGIGDINSSFLPKIQEPPKKKTTKTIHPKTEEAKPDPENASEDIPVREPSTSTQTTSTDGQLPQEEPDQEDGGSKISALEELVKMGGGDDQMLRQEQAAEQEKFLEKQLTERPLLHMQEKLEEEEAAEESSGDSTSEHPHHRHNLLKDDDVELMYLERHLSQVHKSFYEQYDGALVNARGGRVAQLKPGYNKKIAMKDEAADLKIVPDIAHVMPALKSKVLAGTTLVMSGLVPLSTDLMRSVQSILQFISRSTPLPTSKKNKIKKKKLFLVISSCGKKISGSKTLQDFEVEQAVDYQWKLRKQLKQANKHLKWYEKKQRKLTKTHRSEIVQQARFFGADVQERISKRITHLITVNAKTHTHKALQAAKYPQIKIVTHQWLLDSISKWEMQDETPYLVEIHDVDRRREALSSYPFSLNVSESEDDTASETEELDSVPASQEEEHEDSEGVMPDDFPDGLTSPVDDLKTFDWDGVDDELNEFLGSDSDDDSDASESSRASVKDSHGRKRNHDVVDENEDDSDEGSVTAKKARISNSRSTGLKASHEAESSLPTPGPMDEDDDDDWGLEADLEAELEREEEETAGNGG